MWHHVRTLNLGVKTDWNTDRHCALNLKNKYIYKHIKKKKKTWVFFFPLSLFLRGRKWEFFFQVFFFFFFLFLVWRREQICEGVMRKNKNKKTGCRNRWSGWPMWGKFNLVPNAKFKALVLIPRRTDGIRGGKCGGMEEERGQRVCLSVCEQLRHLATTKFFNWERMTWGKPNVAPRGVVTACVSSSSRLFQVLGSVPGPAPRCSPANRTGWDQSDRTLELLRFQLGENYTVPLSVSEGWRR